MNRQFFRENIQLTNQHMKRCLISLIIRKMQIKPAMKYQYTLARMAIIENTRNNKC